MIAIAFMLLLSISIHLLYSLSNIDVGFQLLHCLANDPSLHGGESVFMDGIAAAQELKLRCVNDKLHWLFFCARVCVQEISICNVCFGCRDSEAFQSLCSIPATFQKVRGGGAAGGKGTDRAVHMVYRCSCSH